MADAIVSIDPADKAQADATINKLISGELDPDAVRVGDAPADDTQLEIELSDETETSTVDESPEAEPAEADAQPEAEETTQAVDYELIVPMPDGEESMPLGQLKDRYVAITRREVEIQKREAEIASEYGALAQANAEIEANGQPLNQEQRQVIARMQEERVNRESRLMLKAIPEWSDQTKFQSDKQEMVEMLAPYGISESQLNGITDHRMALFFKHHLEMVRKLKTAAEIAPKPKAPVRGPKGQATRPLTKKAAVDKLVQRATASDDENLKTAAVSALLRGV